MPILRRTLSRHATVDNGQKGLTALTLYPESSRDSCPSVTETPTRQSLRRFKWTKTHVALIVVTVVLVTGWLYIPAQPDVEAIYQQINQLRQSGADRTTIVKTVGSPQISIFAISHGQGIFLHQPHDHSSASSWVKMSYTLGAGCTVSRVTVYFNDDGKVTDVEVQSVVANEVSLWRYLVYRLTENLMNACPNMTLDLKPRR